ncbi:MAG: YlmC/YmxH family sporulation protein [Acutalibacteraceae bacterium]
MIERASQLFDKEVICLKDGTRLGLIGEFEIDTATGRLETVIIPGRSRLFGLLGREEDITIPFGCIVVFGEEVILADLAPPPNRRAKRSILDRRR